MPAEAWGYFVILRDRLRRKEPGAKIPSGVRGTRRVLKGWLEGQLEELAETL